MQGGGQHTDYQGALGVQAPSMSVPGMVPRGFQKCGGPSLLQVTFNGRADQVAIFISQVLSYLDLYGHFYPSQWSMVVAITTILTGEAADWVADLHSDHAQELTDVGMFLEGLRAHFKDDTRTQQAEGELVSLKQRGHPAKTMLRTSRRSWGGYRHGLNEC